jgi:hypothetical protein
LGIPKARLSALLSRLRCIIYLLSRWSLSTSLCLSNRRAGD